MSCGISRELVEFVSSELRIGSDRLQPTTRLLHDLGVDGDDGSELIEAFGRRFAVDLSAFEPARHFGAEGLNVFAWLWGMIRGTPSELIPITLADLQASIESRRWVGGTHGAA